MRKMIVSLMLGVVLVVLGVPSEAQALPKLSNVEKALNLSATAGPANLLGTQIVSNKVQLLKCKYDYAIQGGSTAAAIKLDGPDGADCVIPDNAVIIDGLLDVITNPLSPGGGNATIALSSGKAAGDLRAATTINLYGGLAQLLPVGTTATAIKMTADVNPTMTIANSVSGSGLTAGKFNVFIQYYLSE